MLHLNNSSLQKHFDSLHETLHQLPILPQIIDISETSIKNKPYLNISLPKYHFLYANSTTQAGGVGIYINNSISFDKLGKNELTNAGCEDLFLPQGCKIP